MEPKHFIDDGIKIKSRNILVLTTIKGFLPLWLDALLSRGASDGSDKTE